MLAACAPTTSLPLDVPAEITHVGTVRADAIDVPRPASGLLPATGNHLFFTQRDQPWLLFGYDEATLEPFRLPEPATLAVTPVRPALEDEKCWRLPAPSWSTPLDPSADGRAIPPLTSAWARQCPGRTGSPRSWFDVRCGSRVLNCGQHPVPDEASCVTSLVALECESVATQIAIESDGGACPIEASRPATCDAEIGPEGDPRWSCQNGCTFDFYHPQTQAAVIDSVALTRPNEGPNELEVLDNIRIINLTAGGIDALGVSGDLVLATLRSPVGQAIGFCPIDHPEILRTQVRVDVERWPTSARSRSRVAA